MNETTAGFDGLADAYDRFRTGYAPEIYEALGDYGLASTARVLDVGCGTGLVTAELTARGATVTGIDISEPMVERARARVPACHFRIESADALSFADASFDAATCAQAFHWFDQPRVLAELARVVRPGGIVAVWWKGLMRGDGLRQIREDVAREIGLVPPPDLLTTGFAAFENSVFEDRRLRVIPWQVSLPVEDFLGYERSRARSRDAYGDRIGDYIELLGTRLRAGSDTISLFYTHLLYLGRVPEKRG